jgi:ABC-type antimicrobial peptide transport system permease subunit
VYDNGLREPAPAIVYWPLLMQNFYGVPVNVRRSVTFAIRSGRAGTQGLLAEVRDAIGAVNPDVALTRVRTLGDVYDGSLAATSFTLVMLAIASAMALFLGIVGIYGVIAYAVAQRRREIGIRMALGARPGSVFRLVMTQGFAVVAAGAVTGGLLAVVAARAVSGALYGLGPSDPAAWAGALGLVLFVACLANAAPAFRAARVAPSEALRAE